MPRYPTEQGKMKRALRRARILTMRMGRATKPPPYGLWVATTARGCVAKVRIFSCPHLTRGEGAVGDRGEPAYVKTASALHLRNPSLPLAPPCRLRRPPPLRYALRNSTNQKFARWLIFEVSYASRRRAKLHHAPMLARRDSHIFDRRRRDARPRPTGLWVATTARGLRGCL